MFPAPLRILAPIVVAFFLGLSCTPGDNSETGTGPSKSSAYTLSGVVEDNNGKEIPGVTVSTSDGSHSTETDAAGAFALQDLKEGTYTLTFTHHDYRDTSVKSITLPGGSEMITDIPSVALTFRYATIKGTVVDPSNSPIVMAGVAVEQQARNSMTTSDGSFILTRVEPGDIKLFGAYPDLGYGTLPLTASPQDTIKNASIVLDRNGGTVAGRLTRPEGAAKRASRGGFAKSLADSDEIPLVGAVVTAMGGTISDTTDSSGGFSLSGVPSDGEVALDVKSEDGDMVLSGIRATEEDSSYLGAVPLVSAEENAGAVSLLPGLVFANTTDGAVYLYVKSEGDSSLLTSFSWDTDSDGSADTTTSSASFRMPTPEEGTHYVRVTGSSADGKVSASTRLTVVVRDENLPPFFLHGPSWMTAETPVGNQYIDTVHAVDINGDRLQFSIVTGPQSMTISDSIISWTPTAEQQGLAYVSVAVNDKNGGDTLSWIVVVREDAASASIQGLWKYVSQSVPLGLKPFFGRGEHILDIRDTMALMWKKSDTANAGYTTETLQNGESADIDASSMVLTRTQGGFDIQTTYRIIDSRMVGFSAIGIADDSLVTAIGYDSTNLTLFYERYAGALPPVTWGTTTPQPSTDTDPPSISAISPPSGVIVLKSPLRVEATVKDANTIAAVFVDGTMMQGFDDRYAVEVELDSGTNVLPLMARDIYGNISRDTLRVTFQKPTGTSGDGNDSIAPVISTILPASGETVGSTPVTLTVIAHDSGSGIASVVINQMLVQDSSGSNVYMASVPLMPGPNTITVQVQDRSGNTTTQQGLLFLEESISDTTIPDSATPGQRPHILSLQPQSGDTVLSSPTPLTVELSADAPDVHVFIDGEVLEKGPKGAYVGLLQLDPGANSKTLTVLDNQGIADSDTLHLFLKDSAPDTSVSDTTSPGDSSTFAVLITAPGRDTVVSEPRVVIVTEVRGGDQDVFLMCNDTPMERMDQSYFAEMNLAPGSNNLIVRAISGLGDSAFAQVTVTYDENPGGDTTVTDTAQAPDTTGFFARIVDPSKDTTVFVSRVDIEVEVSDEKKVQNILCNDKYPLEVVSPNRFKGEVSLVEGSNRLVVRAVSNTHDEVFDTVIVTFDAGSGSDTTVTDTGSTPPDTSGFSVSIINPTRDTTVSISQVTIGAQVTDNASLQEIFCNEMPMEQTPWDAYRADVQLLDGPNTVVVRAISNTGTEAFDTVEVTFDQGSGSDTAVTDTGASPPDTSGYWVAIVDPSKDTTVDTSPIEVEAQVSDLSIKEVYCDGRPMQQAWQDKFRATVDLVEGSNAVVVRANTNGGEVFDTVLVNYTGSTSTDTSVTDTSSIDSSGFSIEIVSPSNDTTIAQSGVVIQAQIINGVGVKRVYCNNQPMQMIGSDLFRLELELVPGTHNVQVRATNSIGTTVTDTVVVTYNDS